MACKIHRDHRPKCDLGQIRRNDTCRATQPRLTTTWLNSNPTERRRFAAVRDVVLANLPDGYEEVMQYGMISYIVPTSILAETYNGQPLMYAALASQKRYMSLYLTNVYSDEGSAEWFRQRYAETGKKLNMGKSCVRFRNARGPAPRRGRRGDRADAHGRISGHLPRIQSRPPQVADGTPLAEKTWSNRRSSVGRACRPLRRPVFNVR